jgi:hypothetical protein
MIILVDYDELDWQERREVRLKYIEQQNNICHYCGSDLRDHPSQEISFKKINRSLFPETFFNYPVHLHHDHNTGLTIGAVHARCNAVL